jgi:hypothetical protein
MIPKDKAIDEHPKAEKFNELKKFTNTNLFAIVKVSMNRIVVVFLCQKLNKTMKLLSSQPLHSSFFSNQSFWLLFFSFKIGVTSKITGSPPHHLIRLK